MVDDKSNECIKGKSCHIERRNFLGLTALFMSLIGLITSIWPLLKSLLPSKEVLALSTVEVNLSGIQEGQSIKVKWQGKPVFIRKRTKQEIEEAKAVDIKTLRDPQTDEQRTHPGKEEWLVAVGVCTHLGCIPIEQDKGWFCPCHGSYYDISGRIIKGPAPHNLIVPDYFFSSKDVIVIGKKGEDA